MTRTRIFLTLLLVAAAAMLLGLIASSYVVRYLAPGAERPAAIEPQRPQPPPEDIPINV